MLGEQSTALRLLVSGRARTLLSVMAALATVSAMAVVLADRHAARPVGSVSGATLPAVTSLVSARLSSDDHECHFFWRGLCAQADCKQPWIKEGSCADAGYPVCCVGYWGPHNGWYREGQVTCTGVLTPCKNPDDRDEFLPDSEPGGDAYYRRHGGP